MTKNKMILPLLAVAATLALSACGGGGGTVSTPAPTPTPTPPPTYTKLSDLTGDQTFRTGGIHWQNGSGGITGRGGDAFGGGVTIAYTATTDSYTVTTPSGITTTFTPADIDAASSSASTDAYRKATPNGQQTLRLVNPSINGVPLSYTMVGNFFDGTSTVSSSWIAAGGVPTVASDMPRAGSATYTAQVGANVLSGGILHIATTSSTATFAANFGAGTINTSLHLIALPSGSSVVQDFGTFTGTGTITSGGPGFSGTFAGTTGPGFSGAFFGPQAAEAAYSFNFVTSTMEAFGSTIAKQ